MFKFVVLMKCGDDDNDKNKYGSGMLKGNVDTPSELNNMCTITSVDGIDQSSLFASSQLNNLIINNVAKRSNIR